MLLNERCLLACLDHTQCCPGVVQITMGKIKYMNFLHPISFSSYSVRIAIIQKRKERKRKKKTHFLILLPLKKYKEKERKKIEKNYTTGKYEVFTAFSTFISQHKRFFLNQKEVSRAFMFILDVSHQDFHTI